MNKYDLIKQKENNGKVPPLTQDQVNYILDNKNSLKQTEIAKNLGINYSRVNDIVNGRKYKELINHYYLTHSSQ